MEANTATMQMRRLRNSMKRVASVFRRVLRSRHLHMSRPYTVDDEPYRTCLECGARRRMDRHTWTKLHPYCL
jgi:hypothetical protein